MASSHLHGSLLDVFKDFLRCLRMAAPPVSPRDFEACANVENGHVVCVGVLGCGVCV